MAMEDRIRSELMEELILLRKEVAFYKRELEKQKVKTWEAEQRARIEISSNSTGVISPCWTL